MIGSPVLRKAWTAQILLGAASPSRDSLNAVQTRLCQKVRQNTTSFTKNKAAKHMLAGRGVMLRCSSQSQTWSPCAKSWLAAGRRKTKKAKHASKLSLATTNFSILPVNWISPPKVAICWWCTVGGFKKGHRGNPTQKAKVLAQTFPSDRMP